jgi:hypothetical protein
MPWVKPRFGYTRVATKVTREPGPHAYRWDNWTLT